MGGIRRQRKFKACDPYSKEQLKKNKTDKKDNYDLPPKKGGRDGHFSESKSLMKFKKQVDMGRNLGKKNMTQKPKENVETKKKHRVKAAFENAVAKQPNETQKQYFRRLDEKIQNAVVETYKDSRKIRSKRKEHLKARDEKKKSQNKPQSKRDTDFNELKDDVKFGEVAQAPPSISFAPRKAPQNKPKVLHLSTMLEKNSSKLKRRKDMSEAECEVHDTERQRAIDAYRLMKKRKELKDIT